MKSRQLITLLLLSTLLLIQNARQVPSSSLFSGRSLDTTDVVEQISSLNSTTTAAHLSPPGPPCLPPETGISMGQFQAGGRNVSIPGHVVPSVGSRRASRTLDLSASYTLHMQLVFSLRNAATFKQCLESLSDPTSPNFRHFLNATTLGPYAPTLGQKKSMTNFLQKAGFTVSDGPSPIVLELTGNVRMISRAFNVKMGLYRQANISFYSPDSDPMLPQNLASLTNSIVGLDNSSRIVPADTPCTGPYCPQGIQVGYSFSTLHSNGYDGSGTKVAIVDAPGDPAIQNALNSYDTQYGLPAVTLDIRYPDGTPSSYDASWASETAMDVEAVHTTAKGAGIVLLYDISNPINAIDYVAANHLATIVSNSWMYVCASSRCSDTQLSSSLVSSVDSRLATDAAQGLTILFSSGDDGATPDGSNFGTGFPASDPNVLSVGATNLILNGCGSTTCSGYGSESGALISGGGYSGHFAEPSWQTNSIGTKPGRAVPDVSMLGYNPGFWVYSTASDMCNGDGVNRGAGWFGCAGTSLSAPLWAGLLAIAEQRAGAPMGNIAPTIYQLGTGALYANDFHDITTGMNNRHGSGYSAAPGWDPVTGWGTPIADKLTSDLAPYVLHVQSSPITNVLISLGSPPTPYQNTNFDITSPNSFISGPFTAQPTATVGSSTYTFDHWTLDGINMGGNPLGAVEVGSGGHPNGRIAVAVYVPQFTTTTTAISTSTSTSITTRSSTTTYQTSTTTTSTSTSISTVGEVCYSATSTTQTTSVTIQGTVTSITVTSKTTTTTSSSTALTTTSSTKTLTSVTTTTTTTSACTASTVSISTSVTLTTTTVSGHLLIPIQLQTGWNLVSLPVVPLSTSISYLLKSQIAAQDVSIVWSYTGTPRTWQSYVPSKGGTLTTMVDGNAYWIYMTKNDTLYVDGTVIPPSSSPPTYSLVQGWNLVGFKPEPAVQNETVGAYLSSITGSYDAKNVWVYDNSGESWIRADSSYALQPGQGIWILMTAPATLKP